MINHSSYETEYRDVQLGASDAGHSELEIQVVMSDAMPVEPPHCHGVLSTRLGTAGQRINPSLHERVKTDLGRWGERGGALAPAAPPTAPYVLEHDRGEEIMAK